MAARTALSWQDAAHAAPGGVPPTRKRGGDGVPCFEQLSKPTHILHTRQRMQPPQQIGQLREIPHLQPERNQEVLLQQARKALLSWISNIVG